MKEQILGTGLSGLVGSRVVELNPDFNFVDASLETGINILDKKELNQFFKDNPLANTVIHFAAFTDTNAAQNQRGDKRALCYQLNVVGTQNIVNLCHQYNKHLIHISTDFVFNGEKKSPYIETDPPQPIDWYGETKAMAEKIVADSQISASIIRIAYPYRSSFPSKIDLIRKIKDKLEKQQTVTLFSDQITTPTFIDDIALGLKIIIENKAKGIYHLVASSFQSPHEMANLIAQSFNLDQSLIKASSLSEYLKTPDIRPYAVNGAISNQKFVSEFSFTPKTLSEGLEEIKKQLS